MQLQHNNIHWCYCSAANSGSAVAMRRSQTTQTPNRCLFSSSKHSFLMNGTRKKEVSRPAKETIKNINKFWCKFCALTANLVKHGLIEGCVCLRCCNLLIYSCAPEGHCQAFLIYVPLLLSRFQSLSCIPEVSWEPSTTSSWGGYYW